MEFFKENIVFKDQKITLYVLIVMCDDIQNKINS